MGHFVGKYLIPLFKGFASPGTTDIISNRKFVSSPEMLCVASRLVCCLVYVFLRFCNAPIYALLLLSSDLHALFNPYPSPSRFTDSASLPPDYLTRTVQTSQIIPCKDDFSPYDETVLTSGRLPTLLEHRSQCRADPIIQIFYKQVAVECSCMITPRVK